MAGADTVFRVLTEFKFEAGAAIAQSNAVAGAVGKISDAADTALFSLQRLGIGFMANMGLGAGGITGVLYGAISASEKFYQSQIKISNMFQASGFFKGPQAYEEAFLASEKAMNNIRNISNQFSLPASDLLATTQLLFPILGSKGLDDGNMTKSLDLSRQFLKASPILGVDPGLAMGQLAGMLTGRTDMGGAFSQRLFADTKTLKGYSGAGGTQKFNALSPEKRLNLLTKALGEFADNTKAAEAIAGSLSGQISRLKDNLIGVFSIFKPLGDILSAPIRDLLGKLNNYISKEGPKIMGNFAKMLKPIFENPEELLKNILQIRNMKKDLQSAGKSVGFGGIIYGIGEAIHYLGGAAAFASPWIGVVAASTHAVAQGIGRAFPFLEPIIKFFSKLVTFFTLIFGIAAYFGKAGALLAIIVKLGAVLLGLLPPLLLAITFFQLLSRAAAIAKIDDTKALAEKMTKLQEVGLKYKAIFGPLIDAFMQIWDGAATIISPLFKFSWWIDALAKVLNFVADVVAHLIAMLEGAIVGFLQRKQNLSDGKILGQFDGVIDAYRFGVEESLKRSYGRAGAENATNPDGSVNTSKNNININKIEINQDFKEAQDPDRIAFTLKEQLIKAALNPLQASGRSLKGGLVTGQ